MKKKTTEPILGGVNIIPIIDVSLILLILLMVTNPFLATPNLPITLPQAKTLEAHEKNLTITLTKEGEVALNREIISFKLLPKRLAEAVRQDRGKLLIIRADAGLSYGVVQDVLDMAAQGGAKNVAVGTEQPEEPR